jgi:hypothetical protein
MRDAPCKQGECQEAVAERLETPNFPERVGPSIYSFHIHATIAVRASHFTVQPSLLQLRAASSLISTTL